jgi:Na+/proline symporter
VLAAVADVLAVLVFAAVGRDSHAEAMNLAGLSGTAAPFLAGLLVSWLAGRTWRAPTRMRTGAVVWVGTTVVGLALRAAVTHRLPPTFVLVTAISLAVLLFGWRAVALAVTRARPRTT